MVMNPTNSKKKPPFWRLFFIEVVESFWMALDAVTAHRLRSTLTLLGVVVGVFSIILVMTAMRALQHNIETELSQLGVHSFQVQKWPAIHTEGPQGWEKIRRRKNITYQQVRQLEARAALAKNIALEANLAQSQAWSRFDKTNPNVSLTAVTPDTFAAKNWTIEGGRALMEQDLDSARNVCVLGSSLTKKLFPLGAPLGEQIKFDGINYTVVGFLESKGDTLGGDQGNFVAVPITTGLNRYGRERSVNVLVQAQSEDRLDDTMEQVIGALRAIRKVPPGAPNDFEIFSNDTLVDQFRAITLAVRVGVAIVSSIALIAAGIGIMNIMLVAVTERTREIGIRRAVGASKRIIMAQFILEAIVLCEIGGVIGVLLGIAGGNLAAHYMNVPPNIPFDWALIGLVICSLVGIIFGTYPAYKAANLDPIESLRYE